MLIPNEWKSKRQVIVETFIKTGSVPETALIIYGDRKRSYVRTIIIQWKRFLREKEKASYELDEVQCNN